MDQKLWGGGSTIFREPEHLYTNQPEHHTLVLPTIPCPLLKVGMFSQRFGFALGLY